MAEEQDDTPNLFQLIGPPIATDPGTIYDYDSSTGEKLQSGFGRQFDTNPFASGIARPLNMLNEDLMAIAGAAEWVSADKAREDIAKSGLDLKVPDNGVSKYELETLKYLKKREREQQQLSARNTSMLGTAAEFTGGLAAGVIDPLNVASAFIPIVPEARYAAWVAQSSGVFGRAAVRAGAGVIEGTAGAALLEPLSYYGATNSQLEYTAADSFINVVFGGAMGAGLHSVGGIGFDAYNAGRIDAARSIGDALPYITQREAAGAAPDDVKLDALHGAVRSLENDLPVRADETFDAWHGSPREFDKFELTNVGVENGANFGYGIYLTLARKIADRYAEGEVPGSVYQVSVKAKLEEFIDWEKPFAEQSPMVQSALEKVFGESASKAEIVQLPNGRWALKNSAGEIIGRKDGFPERGLADYQKQILDESRAKSAEQVFIDNKTGLPRADNAEMSKKLRDAGIKGVIYNHRALEGDGGGLQNLVMFDPSDIVVRSRNGEPIVKPEAPTRPMDDPADMEASALADRAAMKADDIEQIAADTDFLDQQINGMKSREMWSVSDDAALAAGEVTAKKLETTATVYRAAAVCMTE